MSSNEFFSGFSDGQVRPAYADGLGLAPDDQLLIPHAHLLQAIDMAIAFNEDERPHQGEYLRRQFADFEQGVSDVPGYQGVFGTGHPFYAWKPDGGIAAIREVSEYTESYKPWITADRARNLGSWPCAGCQRDRSLPDLKQECKPCDLVSYKPRDLFKVLPDLDFWVIVDEAGPDVLAAVEESVRREGFYTSDEAIKQALLGVMSVMGSMQRGEIPQERMPIDMHVVTTAELSQAMSQVSEQLGRDDEPGFIPISPHSLRASWEHNDLPYDFLKDFLFSFTPCGWRDGRLIDQLAETREQARAILKGDAVNYVAELSPIAARQLRTEALRQILEDRVAGW